MPKKGYKKNGNNDLHQPSTYGPQPLTFGDKSIYPPMTSKERDTRLGSLLNKEEKIQEEMDIAEAEAEENNKAIEHNKKKIDDLHSEKSKEGIISRVVSYFSYGNLPQINKEIEELQSKQAKHERHEQELREQIRAHVSEQEDNIRSKNDIKRMFLDSGRDSTDGSRVSTINYNYFKICKFIEKYVKGFTFKEPSDYALMHELANKVSTQYFGNKGYKKPIDALYDYRIDDNMLIVSSNNMGVFQSGDTVKAFLEQARQAEQAKQREKAESSQRHNESFAKVLSSRPLLSLVPPEEYEANPQKHEANPNEKKGEKRKRDEVEVKDENKSKSRRKKKTSDGGRRARHSRKSKK
jgi:hypothetical protein